MGVILKTMTVEIPCSSCEHTSDSDLAAFEHWRENHKRIEGEELGPGLHKVGDHPWDYVYNPAKGQRIACVVNGEVVEGTVTDFVRNRATGEISLTVAEEKP